MTISVGDKLKASVVWRMDGADEQVNVYHLRFTQFPDPVTDDMVRIAIGNYFEDLYSEVLGDVVNNLVHNRVELWNETTNSPELPLPAISALNGQDSGVKLPYGTSMLIFGRTGVSRRIGRKFLPTYSTGAVTDGFWSSGAQTRAADFASKWAAPYEDDNNVGIRAIVFKNDASWSDILQGVVQPNPCYQRRRRAGRGG